MSWGVYPVLSKPFPSLDVVFYNAMIQAQKILKLKKGDNVVLTGGPVSGSSGNTNTIKVEVIS